MTFHMAISKRRLLIVGALNRRGIKGHEVRVLLHRYSQERVARQIDYYDFEISSAAGLQLPLWAAAPWLSHRIRRNGAPPAEFQAMRTGVAARLAGLPG